MRENLKKARIERNMSQQKIADYLDIKVRAYKYLESGHTQGKISTWDKLEDLFGINQRVLREDRNEREP